MKLLKKLMLLTGALLLAFGVCEVAVRALVPVRNVGPSFTTHDPDYGARLKVGFSTTRVTPEFTMRLTTNSLGFRGPEPPSTGRRPVLFLGDSFTMGYGVDDGEEFPALIRKAFRERASGDPIPVINAGRGDSGNGWWVKFLRAEAPAHDPRLIVLQVCSNDDADNTRERLFEITADGALIERPVPAPSWKRRVQGAIEAIPGLPYSYIVGLARQIRATPRNDASDAASSASREPAADSEPGRPSDSQRLTARLVEEAITICERHDWPILAVLADLDGDPRDFYVDLFEAHDVPVVSLPSKRERPDLYFEVDGHWRTAGHAFAATRVLEAIDARD